MKEDEKDMDQGYQNQRDHDAHRSLLTILINELLVRFEAYWCKHGAYVTALRRISFWQK